MSAILRRAHRATLLFVVALLGLSLVSPLVTLGQASFTPGETAVISAGGGSVNVRASADPNAESLGQIPDGTEVYIVDGPFTAGDGSIWYQAGVWDLTGYINASMLGSVSSSSSSDTAGSEPEAPATSTIPWKQPIDYGVVVDNSNAPLPGDGLACRTAAESSASTIARLWIGQSVEVVGQSVWSEGIEFLPINCEGVGGFVKADYVALQSQQAVVTEEVAVTEEVVVTEEVAAVDPNAPVAGDLIVTVLDQNGAAVPGGCFTLYLGGEWIAESCDSSDAVPNNGNSGFFGIAEGSYTLVSTSFAADNQEVRIGAGNTAYATVYTSTTAPAETEVVATEEAVTEEPVTEEVATEDVVTEEPVTEEVATEDIATDEAATEEPATEEVVDGTPIVTEIPVTEEPTGDVSTETPVTEEATDEATAEATVTEEASEEATEAPGSTLGEPIGDATVTGTNGEGIRCRVAPDASAATIMTLNEGTTVFVYAEPVNGYLAIACGDQIGYGDVNYLWSGGAGDEIPSNASSVIVVGTGGLPLNCRAGAGTSFGVVGTVSQGTVLTSRGASSNGWAPVVCAGKNGFVSISYVEVTSQAPDNGGGSNTGGTGGQSGTVTVTGTGSSLRCRTAANTNASIITSLPDGTVVTTRGAASNGWLPVVCAGQNGFVSSEYTSGGSGSGNGSTTPTPTATANPGNGGGTTGAYVKVTGTGGSSLNCRTAASMSGMVITSVPFGSTVATRGAASNGWVPVTCGGKAGYVSSTYVTATTDPGNGGGNGNPAPGDGGGTTGSAVVDAGGDNLRCRTAASSSASVITSVAHGTTVTTRGASSNGWTPVVCGGQNGFMSSEFLRSSGGGSGTTPTPTPTQTPPPSNGGGMTNGDHGKVNARANMRYQASMSANVMTTVDAGEVLLITGPVTNGFYPVDYDGWKAFMHADLLTETSEPLSKRGGSGNDPDPGTPPPGNGSATGSAIVNFAMRYIGYPYVAATHGPSSFDCSGFTHWVVKNVMGKDIGTGTWTQTVAGTTVSRSSLQPGDLVFFQNTYKAGLSHVGIYIGNNQFVHAENENTGVRVSDLNSSYYSSRWYGAVRLG